MGDFLGFVAGAALLLDYTIDIALFATASAGYFNFFIPATECGVETEVILEDGEEVVSVYCIKHKGVDAHIRPVYMRGVPSAATKAEPEVALNQRC